MRDQEMLRLIRTPEKSSLSELAAQFVESDSTSEVFEYFVGESFAPHLLPLLSEIHARLRRRDGVGADLKKADGSFAPWRVAHRFLDWSIIEPWLIAELLKCIPGYLRLLNSIYYFWTARETNTRVEREAPRAAVHKACKRHFGADKPEIVCSSFDPSFPWTLFHLVFTTEFEKRESVPLGTVADWAWLGPVLLPSVNHCPSTLLPQLVIAANAFETRRRDVIVYRFNEELLEAWFGDERHVFLQMVGAYEAETISLDANAVEYLRAAKQEAIRLLSSI